MSASDVSESLLRVAFGDTPVAHDMRKLVERTLRRGERELTAQAFGPIEGFSPRAIEGAISLWQRRMVIEHHSAAVWSSLVPQLIAAGATLDFKLAALKAAQDELYHAALCGELLLALGAEPVAQTPLELRPLPAHGDCAPIARVLRNAIFIGCMAETVAVALTSEERQLATQPFVSAMLDQVHADETTHARFGWALLAAELPTLDAAARHDVEAYLPYAFAHLEADLFHKIPAQPAPEAALAAELAALGVSENNAARTLVVQTVEAVIVPQLEALGLTAEAAWRDRADRA
jgi:hypothetical protein